MSLDWLNEQTAQKRRALIVASERVVDWARLYVEHLRDGNGPASEYALEQLGDALTVERSCRFDWDRASTTAVEYMRSMQGEALPFEAVQ
jgi:hypothetical protein